MNRAMRAVALALGTVSLASALVLLFFSVSLFTEPHPVGEISGALFAAFLAAALGAFLVARGLGRGPSSAVLAPTPGGERPTPVPVPPEESELDEGPVAACLRCGSTRLEMARLDDGLMAGAGETLLYVCRACGFRGQPLMFTDATGYRQFVKALNEPHDE
ncbi:MAG: hypothetical protein ACYDCK_10430 [Thermoplasmatota archaeon]